jgi:uncharacterized protein (TIGR03435 family)
MRAPRVMAGLTGLLVIAPGVLAQTVVPSQTPVKLEFEVASVRPTTTQGFFTIDFPAGGFFARNVTVQNLLRTAYRLEDYQISGGPSWITSAGFDIQARAAAGAGEPPREQVLQMLQALLADRFQLALHRETRQLPIYALVVGKSGPKLQAADSSVGGTKMMLGQLIVKKMNMTALGSILAFDLKRPVKDETGLQGEFAFTLEWAPGLAESPAESNAGPSSKPSLFAAVQEQLGLKLESTKGPIEVFVIDHVEKPSED